MNDHTGSGDELNVSGRLKRLIKANQSLANLESLDALLPQLLDLAQEVTGAEASSILLYNSERKVLEFALAKTEGLGQGTEQILKSCVELKLGEGLAGCVAANRQPLIIQDVQADSRFFRQADLHTGFCTRTLLCVPIVYGDELLGVIEVLNSKEKPCFDAEDQELLDSFAQLAAVAIIRSRLLDTQLKQQRLQVELEAASQIQSLFWPECPDLGGGSNAWAVSLPAAFVGGDLYDLIPMPDGSWLAYVADVCGKGLPAALIMGALWTRIRSEALAHGEVDRLLERVNHTMYSLLAKEGFFATIIIGKYWPTSGRMQLARGGHLIPVWIVGGDIGNVPDMQGIPLGIIPSPDYQTKEILLEPGQSILFITDGVTEARNEQDELFDHRRIVNCIRTATGPPWGNCLVDAVKTWRGNAEASDDLTILEIWRAPTGVG
ncbi:MAG: SpoIIE family protein phosphatase [Deltaproteobacteria bacterium]|nr:MAG: SpoIIE family protein phosphatase [Deltaproteobacteria bacterium]